MADDKRRFEMKPVERRTFLRYGLIGSVSAGLGFFGLSSLGFLWPRPGEGLFGEVAIDFAANLASEVTDLRTPVRIPEGGISIVVWDPSVRAAERNYAADHQAILDDNTALMALNSRSCPHLGCAVPWCQTSQWFECPCHGSKYNTAGEYKLGPAPRGLDRFKVAVSENGDVLVDTAEIILGPPRGADTLNRPPSGPYCVAVV